MPQRRSGFSEEPRLTSLKTLHESIMAKLGEQLRERFEPAQQLPAEMLTLVDRLHTMLEE
jgi:hypothetical protein